MSQAPRQLSPDEWTVARMAVRAKPYSCKSHDCQPNLTLRSQLADGSKKLFEEAKVSGYIRTCYCIRNNAFQIAQNF